MKTRNRLSIFGCLMLMPVIAALVFATPATVLACGFCMAPSGGLKFVHPKSLQVAVAIRRDLDSGLLKGNVATPGNKVSDHFRQLQTGRILAERFFLLDGFELLLIEDGSHYRIEGNVSLRRGNRTVPPPIRWVTGRDVLQSMLKNDLDLETAVKRGLVVVERTASRRDSKTSP